jgi:ferredoxin
VTEPASDLVSGPASGPALTVKVNQQTCIGSGVCAYTAPATFSQGADAKVIVVAPAGDPADVIRAAADSCPTRSITVAEQTAENHQEERIGDAS